MSTRFWAFFIALGVTLAPSEFARADAGPGHVPTAMLTPPVRHADCALRGTASGATPFDLKNFTNECTLIEAETQKAAAEHFTRAELLVMMGRTSAAAGRFRVSAAAYLLFLNEFGLQHEWSGRVLVRLIDSLAPLQLEAVDILHTPDGPLYTPVWRLGQAPSAAQLVYATAVCEAAAETGEPATEAEALRRLGWIQRARGDWDAATDAWDRAASIPTSAATSMDLRRLAAENCEWLGQPARAIEHLEQIVRLDPRQAHNSALRTQLDRLRREAARGEAWFVDPVSGFCQELNAGSAATRAERYSEVAAWLKRNCKAAALVSIAEWVAAQEDWPANVRLAAYGDLATVALSRGTVDGRVIAATALGQIAALSDDVNRCVLATVRRSALLRELGRATESLAELRALAARQADRERWEVALLPELVRVLADVGDATAAGDLLRTFAEQHPQHEALPALRAAVHAASQQEGQ